MALPRARCALRWHAVYRYVRTSCNRAKDFHAKHVAAQCCAVEAVLAAMQ